MATVTRENIGKLQDKLTVNLTKEDYLPSFDKALKHYSKTANVPGFRKGMVPAGMIRKMYGQSLFTDEVLRSAGRELENYLRDNKIDIFAQPMIISDKEPVQLDMNNPADVGFSFEIGLKPEFEIPALQSKQKLTRYLVQPTEKMIDDEVERITRRFGKAEEQETITTKDNILYNTYEACDADGTIAEGAKKIEDTVLVEKLPAKLQELLMGKAKGDTLVIRPSDICTEEELAGFLKDPIRDADAKDQYFLLTVTDIKLLIPRQLDALLYSEVFPNDAITDEKQFRERLKAEIGKEYARVGSDRLQNEIYELLVHTTPIELPEAFLKRWLREGQENPKTAEEVEAEYPSFQHQLLWTLISDKLILENKIQVAKEEVDADLKGRVLAYFGMENDDDAPWMDSYLAKVAKDEKTLNETYRRLLFAKLFSHLEQQFTIEDKEISEEEFFKLPNPHDAHHHH